MLGTGTINDIISDPVSDADLGDAEGNIDDLSSSDVAPSAPSALATPVPALPLFSLLTLGGLLGLFGLRKLKK